MVGENSPGLVGRKSPGSKTFENSRMFRRSYVTAKGMMVPTNQVVNDGFRPFLDESLF